MVVYNFEETISAAICDFERIKVGIYDDLEIDFSLIEI